MKDYYKILEVKPNASQAEIKKAYRLLAVTYHPDKNNGSKESEERFKEISESYIILGDTAKRNAYDYTKGNYKNYNGQNSVPGQQTPVTFLILFKRIKERVLNADGRVNKEALFKVINDLLSDDTINFLISARDIATNNLITDEVLTCSIFLSEQFKTVLYAKLLRLSDGDPRFTQKLALLSKKHEAINLKTSEVANDALSRNYIIIFILFLVFFVVLLVVANYSKS